LYQIRPLAAPPQGLGAKGDFELVTRTGETIAWGAAPGHERPGEPTTSDKIARLKKLLAGQSSIREDNLRIGAPTELH
jgi:hypothetical protein